MRVWVVLSVLLMVMIYRNFYVFRFQGCCELSVCWPFIPFSSTFLFYFVSTLLLINLFTYKTVPCTCDSHTKWSIANGAELTSTSRNDQAWAGTGPYSRCRDSASSVQWRSSVRYEGALWLRQQKAYRPTCMGDRMHVVATGSHSHNNENSDKNTISAAALRGLDRHSRQSTTTLSTCCAELAIFLRRATFCLITWQNSFVSK